MKGCETRSGMAFEISSQAFFVEALGAARAEAAKREDARSELRCILAVQNE